MKVLSPSLQRLLEDVSVLRPQLAARRGDLLAERSQEDRQHYYAIDTNIIYFLGQPVLKTLEQPKLARGKRQFVLKGKREHIPHIGSIFRSDPLQYHLTIGVSLAQFISSELSGTSPLFLPTALWPEADTMVLKFMDLEDPETIALADEIFDQVVKRTVEKLTRRLNTSGIDVDELENELRRLVRHKLGREQGLARLKVLLRQGKIDELASRPILSRRGRTQPLWQWQASHRQLEEEFRSRWDTELRAAGKEAAHRRLDSLALSQIQIRNQYAHDLNSNERTLYLTLDAHVIAAAKKIKIEYLNCTFADAFIRHPAAFLNDIGLGIRGPLDPPPASSEKSASLLDWLDVLLVRTSNKGGARENTSDNQSDAKRIRDSWIQLSEIQENEFFLVLGLEQVGGILSKLSATGDIKLILDQLRSEILTSEAAAWHDCFNVAIELALRRNINHQQEPTRSSPSICFEAWPAAAAAIEQFKLWGFEGVRDRKAFDAEVSRLAEAEDRTDYARYLAYAAFFAARGEWRPAAGLSAFARTMAYRHEKAIRGGANGREANFLEAVSRRHLARQPADLLRAQELLAECTRIYAEEKVDWRYPNDIVPERFLLEELDIEQTELMFQWNSDGDQGYIETAATHLLNRYQSLQDNISSQVDGHLRQKHPEILLASEIYVLIQTEIRTIVSMLLMLCIDVVPLTQTQLQRMDEALARFFRLKEARLSLKDDLREAKFAPDNSFMAKFTIDVAGFILSDATRHPIDRNQLKTFRDSIARSRLINREIFPFDRKRFDTIRRIMWDIAYSSPTSNS